MKYKRVKLLHPMLRAGLICFSLVVIPLSSVTNISSRLSLAQDYAKKSQTPEVTEALVKAAIDGDEEVVVRFLGDGVDPNACNKNGETALIVAARHGHIGVIEKLLVSGARVNVRDKNGGTALPAAVEKGDASIFHRLLDAGADKYSRLAAFRIAIAAGHVDIMKELVASGVNPTTPWEGISHVALAVMNNQLESVKSLIALGASVNGTKEDRLAYDALELAARFERVDMCKVLIAAGANSRSKNLALCSAASVGNITITQLLLAAGANVNVKGQYGKTALQHAIENGHADIVQILRAAGAFTGN